ncbi:hypothetical protein [Streptomyces decoyicus]
MNARRVRRPAPPFAVATACDPTAAQAADRPTNGVPHPGAQPW